MNDNKHSNNYNLLRFIFASLVIFSHAIELKDGNRSNEILTYLFGTLSFGELAVDSFFILSGFLISKSWIERPNIASFLKSRILRIYPGFIASSLVCVLIIGPLYAESPYFSNFNLRGYIRSVIFLSDPNISNIFTNSFYPVVNGAIWSIFIELCCYVLLMLFGASSLLSRRFPWLLLTLGVISVYVLNRLNVINISWTGLYIRCGMFFCVGGCFYLYKDQISWKKKYAVTAVFLSMLFLFNFILAEVALAFLWGYSIIYFANNGTRFLAFNKLPDISYGIYLYAWPINKIIYQEAPNTNPCTCMLMTLMASMLIATISWYVVEKPFLNLKKVKLRKLFYSPKAAYISTEKRTPD